ncbi:MAG: putative chemoreceptor glutamine deamidase CheD [Gammaproteobacteria bacterium]|nr:MAG: putative chemoreceptor glutamine deamidase CheD [Gammaproteobacteria bacterium]
MNEPAEKPPARKPRLDPASGRPLVSIRMGEVYVTDGDEVISTVLGSCIAVCVRDRERGVGGMNHFMLPTVSLRDNSLWELTDVNTAARYGSHAMEYLINAVLQKGGRRNHLEFKLFGGGDILGAFTSVGADNVRFIRRYMQEEGYGVAAECLGRPYPIKVQFHPASGVARVKHLKEKVSEVAAEEKRYLRNLMEVEVGGEVELFVPPRGRD